MEKLKVFYVYKEFADHLFSVEIKMDDSSSEQEDILVKIMSLSHSLLSLKKDEVLGKLIDEKDFVSFCTGKSINEIQDLFNNASTLSAHDANIMNAIRKKLWTLCSIQPAFENFFKCSSIPFGISKEQNISAHWFLNLIKDPRFPAILHKTFQLKLPNNFYKETCLDQKFVQNIINMNEDDWQFVVKALVFFCQYHIISCTKNNFMIDDLTFSHHLYERLILIKVLEKTHPNSFLLTFIKEADINNQLFDFLNIKQHIIVDGFDEQKYLLTTTIKPFDLPNDDDEKLNQILKQYPLPKNNFHHIINPQHQTKLQEIKNQQLNEKLFDELAKCFNQEIVNIVKEKTSQMQYDEPQNIIMLAMLEKINELSEKVNELSEEIDYLKNNVNFD